MVELVRKDGAIRLNARNKNAKAPGWARNSYKPTQTAWVYFYDLAMVVV